MIWLPKFKIGNLYFLSVSHTCLKVCSLANICALESCTGRILSDLNLKFLFKVNLDPTKKCLSTRNIQTRAQSERKFIYVLIQLCTKRKRKKYRLHLLRVNG